MTSDALRGLGDEDMSYLTREGHDYVLWETLARGVGGFVDYVVTRHCDTRAPCNHNVSLTPAGVRLYQDGAWTEHALEPGLLRLARADLRAWEHLVRTHIGDRYARMDMGEMQAWIEQVVAPLGVFWSFCTWLNPADARINPTLLRKHQALPEHLRARRQALLAALAAALSDVHHPESHGRG